MDFFQARYFTGALGRFNSVDPDPGSMDFTNPQSFNRYAYVLGNPLAFVDPSGMDCEGHDDGIPCIVDNPPPPPPDPCESDVFCGLPIGWDPGFPGGGHAPPLPQPPPPSMLNPPNNGLTKKQLACSADAAINGALSIFVPGYAATKAVASFAGLSFNPIGALAGTSGLFSGGNPTALQTASGLAGANSIYRDASFAAAGGASALGRVQDLTSRASFGLQTASRQSRLLSQLGNLESLEGAAGFASKANNITAGISAGYDIYKCVTTP